MRKGQLATTTHRPPVIATPQRHASTLLTVALLIALIANLTAQQQAPDGGRRNYDARVAINANVLRAQAPEQQAAVDALRQTIPGLAATYSESFGVTRTLYNREGFLTPPAPGRAPLDVALDYVTATASLLGLETADLVEYDVTDIVRNRATGSTHIYLRQSFRALPVYNAQLHVNVNRDGRILSINNQFVPELAGAISSLTPSLGAPDAVRQVAAHLGTPLPQPPAIVAETTGNERTTTLASAGISQEPIIATLMLLPVQRGNVRLVWNLVIHTTDGQHVYDATVDAETGDVWTRFDWISGDSYQVYEAPTESPIHGSPVAPADGRTHVTDPSDATASPFGWHDTDGIAGPEFTSMRGNNVHAYDDIDDNDAPPASEPDCGVSIDCAFPIDLKQDPSQYTPGALANLFYWNNYIHDIQYQYGFDEGAGNFQVNNYGRGGAANDDVRAEAQDGGGLNNANFFTPTDGNRPRMQMFRFTIADPDRDGDFDNGIIVHEYGHGISNRLVGGPSNVSCLNNDQQPGEGLSDWWSLVYTADTGDTGTDGRGIGTYALGQPTTGRGIRGQRYSTDPAINTWTYASIAGMAIPHGVGSVWAQAAWEMYWALVDAHGFDPDLSDGTGAAGNQRAMLYMNEGLQNTVCSPAFTDVRDGILLAAADNHGASDMCLLWTAFAGVGLGVDAVSGGGNSTTPTDGFSLPASCQADAPGISIDDVSVAENVVPGLATFTATLSKTSLSPVTVDYETADGTAVASTFGTGSNPTAMTVPGSGTSGGATPYPSTIAAPAATTTVSGLTVTLTDLSHTYPSDLDILLEGPTGATVLLMSDVGGGTDVINAVITFADGAPPVGAPVVTGTYRPTNVSSGDTFPSPAPPGPYGSALSVFDGTDPTGTWRLYIVDDAQLDSGSLAGGWSMTPLGPAVVGDYRPTSGTLTFSAGTTNQTLEVEIIADVEVEPDETFFVNLTDAVGANIADGQATGTIVGAVPPPVFTDNPLVVGVTPIRTAHVMELRTRIDALLIGGGGSAFPWTDDPITPGVTPVRNLHLQELRDALDQAYADRSSTHAPYTPSGEGTAIQAIHISELRQFVIDLEAP